MKTNMLGEVAHTRRGFEQIKFQDIYAAPCSLTMSSLAECAQPGVSAVWLGLEKSPVLDELTKQAVAPQMHLDRTQVEALIGHLTRWLENGSFR
jgi:hypothetical protein